MLENVAVVGHRCHGAMPTRAAGCSGLGVDVIGSGGHAVYRALGHGTQSLTTAATPLPRAPDRAAQTPLAPRILPAASHSADRIAAACSCALPLIPASPRVR